MNFFVIYHHSKYHPRDSGRAFSLVELIITTTLLGFILLVLFNLYPQSVFAIKHAEYRMKAATLAQSIIEKKRSGPFGELAAAPSQQEIDALKGDMPYTIDYKCESIPGTDDTKIQKVTVSVSWEERNTPYILTKEAQVCTVHP